MNLNITGDAVLAIAELQAQISEYERIMEAFLFEVLDDKQMNREAFLFKDKQNLAFTVFNKIREIHDKAIKYDQLE